MVADLIEQIDKKEMELKRLYTKLKKEEKSSYPAKVINQTVKDNFSLYQGDCVEVIKGIPANSIHYSIFSPPFLSLFVYSDSERDMGNSKSDSDFYSHFEYLIPELLRVVKTGRLVSVHCSVIASTLVHDNIMGIKDFPGMVVRLFEKHGFIYHSKVVIWKDPLVQATRTKQLSLAHKQIVKDSSRCAMGFADEILTFRTPGDNAEPVSHKTGFVEYVGDLPDPKGKKEEDPRVNKFSHEIWRRYASPVWMDIDQTDTLNYQVARAGQDEKHICPLQLQVIARCLELWTNPGDIVLSPFAGIGSEGYETIKRGRKFVGIELKESYYKTALSNLSAVKNTKKLL